MKVSTKITYDNIEELASRGGVLEDVLGLEDVLEDRF